MLDLQALSSANAEFGVDLYQKLAADSQEGNVFFSPISILFALAMTLMGAREKTEAEMKSVLKLDKFPNDQLHPMFGEMMAHLQDTKGNYTLDIANKLYGEKTYKFLPEFIEECKKLYGAGLEEVDFKNKADECASLISSWVESKTNNKIKNLIPKGVLDKWTRLIIVNAIYFKGNWLTAFDEKHTEPDTFFTPEKEFKNTPFMHFPKVSLKYHYDDELKSQILELPYTGNSLSFVAILPDLEKTQFKKVEQQITGDILSKVSQNLRKTMVKVYLPKFKLETESDVLNSLKNLGIEQLFSEDDADLSGMNGEKNLYVSKLLHKAFVEVNEKGTEAAAATAVVVSRMRSLPVTPRSVLFRADHPFIFFIKDNVSGTVLFMGKLMKP